MNHPLYSIPPRPGTCASADERNARGSCGSADERNARGSCGSADDRSASGACGEIDDRSAPGGAAAMPAARHVPSTRSCPGAR